MTLSPRLAVLSLGETEAPGDVPARDVAPAAFSHATYCDLTRERVMAAVDYDSVTGVFTRRWDPNAPLATNRQFAGKPAGTSNRPYVTVRIAGREYSAHRLAWYIYHGVWPSSDIDHIDQNKFNNAITNLRLCTHQENMFNRRKLCNNKSGYRGVFLSSKGTWAAQIKFNRVKIHIGYFETAEQAARAYDRRARELHGSFACLNFSEVVA